MLNKDKFYMELKRKFIELSINRNSKKLLKKPVSKQMQLCMDVHAKYNFPPGMVSDIVTLRVNMEDALEVLLYAIASFVLSDTSIKTYFTPREIKEYSKYKYETSSIKFPYTFESLMVEIKPDEQYIGRISVKELMKLRDAQIINYNVNTQRTMTLKRGKDYEYYQVTLNRKAIDQMMDLYRNGDFIPNTLTFNLSPETDFTYKDGKLTINDEVPFDILDGYHRYIAFSNLYNIDDTFDYPMEIRIMFANEENARQFIYQEDQKTPLSKVDSSAMNKNDVGVKVCRLVKSKLGNDIINQDGIINEALLVRLIDLLYVKDNKAYKRSQLVSVSNEIISTIEGVNLDVPDLLDERWSIEFTIMFLALANKLQLKGKELYNKTIKTKDIAKNVRIEQVTGKKLNYLLANI